jgi:Tol biopolymer transport system component
MAIGASGGAAVALTDGEKPAWSHDGKLIAFQRVSCEPVCEHDLWLIEPTGDSKRAFVSDNNYNDVEAAFDASATKLAFMRFTLDFDPVYLAVRDVVGGKINIAKVPNDAGAPSWSPDGSQIVLVCDGLTSRGDTDLCVVPADFACSNPFGCDVMQSRLTSSSGNEADPAWSPDGRRIAFTLSCSLAICPPGTTRTEPYLEVIDTATGEDTMLVAGHDAAWSPDGSQLVFVGNASSPGLKVYSFANRSVRHLTDNPLDSSPSWR